MSAARGRAPVLAKPAAGAQRVVVTVTGEQAGLRLDQALSRLADGLSRGRARKIIGMGAVYLGQRVCRVASRKVAPGDVLTATWHDAVSTAERFELTIVHEGPDVVVVNKPSGQLSQGSELGDEGSLVRELTRRFGPDIRLMHRLDKPASGLLVAARNPDVSAYLTPQFREHTITRAYRAIVNGVPADGWVDVPIVKEGRRVRVGVAGEGVPARTRIDVLRSEGDLSCITAKLATGRTHQIRLHLAHLGAPIVGDRRYGGGDASRLCLHAVLLGFELPGGKTRRFDCPPPEDFWLAGGMAASDASL